MTCVCYTWIIISIYKKKKKLQNFQDK